MTASSGKINILFITVLLLVITGCSGTLPDSSLDGENAGKIENIEAMNSIIIQQGKKIDKIEQELTAYQEMIDDQSQVLDVYDDNNQNVREFREKLEKEVRAVLNNIQDGSFEKEVTNTLIKIQKKIQILEDRTFYTDSLYFEIVNDLVMIEIQIENLKIPLRLFHDSNIPFHLYFIYFSFF